MSRIVKLSVYVLLFAVVSRAAWLCLRAPVPMRVFNDIRGIVCTPGYLLRLSQEKAPLELPPQPFAPAEGGPK